LNLQGYILYVFVESSWLISTMTRALQRCRH